MAESKEFEWDDSSGDKFTVEYDGDGGGDISIKSDANTTSEDRTKTVTVQTTKGSPQKEATLTLTQPAPDIVLEITSFTYDDISAAGGTVYPAVVCNAEGAKLTYSGTDVDEETGAVSADSLGTTIKSRTKLTTVTVTATYAGQTVTATCDVYQEYNSSSSQVLSLYYDGEEIPVTTNSDNSEVFKSIYLKGEGDAWNLYDHIFQAYMKYTYSSGETVYGYEDIGLSSSSSAYVYNFDAANSVDGFYACHCSKNNYPPKIDFYGVAVSRNPSNAVLGPYTLLIGVLDSNAVYLLRYWFKMEFYQEGWESKISGLDDGEYIYLEKGEDGDYATILIEDTLSDEYVQSQIDSLVNEGYTLMGVLVVVAGYNSMLIGYGSLATGRSNQNHLVVSSKDVEASNYNGAWNTLDYIYAHAGSSSYNNPSAMCHPWAWCYSRGERGEGEWHIPSGGEALLLVQRCANIDIGLVQIAVYLNSDTELMENYSYLNVGVALSSGSAKYLAAEIVQNTPSLNALGLVSTGLSMGVTWV